MGKKIIKILAKKIAKPVIAIIVITEVFAIIFFAKAVINSNQKPDDIIALVVFFLGCLALANYFIYNLNKATIEILNRKDCA